MIASAVESQSATGTAITTTATDDTPAGFIARQPPIGIETAAATNPTVAVVVVVVVVVRPNIMMAIIVCLNFSRIIQQE